MSGDLELMNRDQVTGYNLAVGEPVFLQDMLRASDWYMRVLCPRQIRDSLQYPVPEGDRLLREQLEWMYPGKYVVVTNGAKGGLFALLSVLRQTYPTYMDIRHATDVHWPTHKTLAKLTGWGFETPSSLVPQDSSTFRKLHMLTAPNNPDGTVATLVDAVDIWDAAYASPIYGFEGPVPYSVASVWSAAKLFGLSGYRVGWVVTGEKWLYEKLRVFVEATTSGVSRIAQKSVCNLLLNWRVMQMEKYHKFNADARIELLETSAELYRIKNAFDKVEGLPETGLGMYAWVKLRDRERFDHALALADARVLGGEYCNASKDWVRISCGLGLHKSIEAFKAIDKAYNTI